MFLFGFLGMVILNSWEFFTPKAVRWIEVFDMFLLDHSHGCHGAGDGFQASAQDRFQAFLPEYFRNAFHFGGESPDHQIVEVEGWTRLCTEERPFHPKTPPPPSVPGLTPPSTPTRSPAEPPLFPPDTPTLGLLGRQYVAPQPNPTQKKSKVPGSQGLPKREKAPEMRRLSRPSGRRRPHRPGTLPRLTRRDSEGPF